MQRKSFLMLATALVLTTGTVLGGGMALAQPGPRGHGAAPIYDPAQLPAVKGVVAQYSLTPRGEVDGLILADGTEVHLPPFLSTQLVYSVKPGDAVTIHGLKAKDLPMIAARSVTNDASGATVVMAMPQGRGRGGATLAAEGKITALMHTPRGEANGVRLADGTIVRMPPGEVRRLGDALAAGKSIAVRGDGYAGPLGRVIIARQLGADADSLKDVAGPRPGERRFGPGGEHGPRHGWMHDDDADSDGDGHPKMHGPMHGPIGGPMRERG